MRRHYWIGIVTVTFSSLTLLSARSVVATQNEATIEATITDERDGALVGATVKIVSPTGSIEFSALTDDRGQFRRALKPGTYRIAVQKPGFRSATEELELVPGETRELHLRLLLAPLAQQVEVVAVSPLEGAGVDERRLPSTVSLLTAEQLRERRASSLAAALDERLGGVSLEGATTNPFQPTLRFRGFTASSLLGLPQGIAVYQNGVRVNEPFGDTVQFDLIPQFALERVQLSAGAEPTFGLNALGGALAMRLKNGFTSEGAHAEIFAGSFERWNAIAEWGGRRGAWGWYFGANRFGEAGFRTASDSDILQAVADIGYRKGRLDAGLSVTYANTSLNGNGPAPVDLLEIDRHAVFTFPDTTENRLAFLQGRGAIELTPTWSLQMAGFYRDLDRRTLNGDTAELDPCGPGSLPAGAPSDTLCTSNEDGHQTPTPLVDIASGRFLTERDARGDAALNRTTTRAKGYGGSLQSVSRRQLSGRENALTLGVSVDLANVWFASGSELGSLTAERSVDGSDRTIGVFGEAPDDRFNTSLRTDNRAVGLYLSDTFSWTPRLHVTASGRFNQSRVEIRDRLGTSLNGDHSFSRFNPGLGLVFQATRDWSIFGRYAESSRAPTAAELSCADPEEPCRVPNAFLSDPPLEQAVARSLEGGLRGKKRFDAPADPSLSWSFTLFHTRTRDDILFVASPVIGAGFFQNAGDTLRVGLDLDVSARHSRLDWYLSYGWVDATFESPLALPGNRNVNDAASADGLVSVSPGDRLPGIPRHSLKAGIGIALSPAWRVSFETIVHSDRFFLGDEGNDQRPLPGYGIINFRSAYAFGERVELFARIDNLLDASYHSFGILAEVEIELNEAPDASSPRFVSPGAPRSAFAGIALRF